MQKIELSRAELCGVILSEVLWNSFCISPHWTGIFPSCLCPHQRSSGNVIMLMTLNFMYRLTFQNGESFLPFSVRGFQTAWFTHKLWNNCSYVVKHDRSNNRFSTAGIVLTTQSHANSEWQISFSLPHWFPSLLLQPWHYSPCLSLSLNVPFEAVVLPSLPSCIWFLILPNVPLLSSLFFSPRPLTSAAEVPSGGREADPVLERQAHLDGEDGAGTGQGAAHLRHSHLHSAHNLPVLQAVAQGSLSSGHAV